MAARETSATCCSCAGSISLWSTATSLAHLDTAKAIPEARQKVRLAAPLFHQRVLLFAKKAIATPGDLKGAKVGVPANRPSRGVTAKTVFATLKIDAHLIEIEEKDFAKKAADELDAVLLFEQTRRA